MSILPNQRHELFAQEVAKGKSATEALALAGYKPHGPNADRLMKNDKIRARIEQILSAAAEKTGITIEWIANELKKIAGANVDDFMHSGIDGEPILDFSRLTRDQKAAIASITVDTYVEGKGKHARTVKKVGYKLWDKRAALVDLGNYRGMFKKKVELSGPGGGPVEVTDARARVAGRIAGIVGRKRESGGST